MSQISPRALLDSEAESVRRWLHLFDMATPPRVHVHGGQTMTVENFPLPDGFRPDYVDLALLMHGFPADPPKGLYLLRTPSNAKVVDRLAKHFNVFAGKGFHGAPSIAGFEWVCVGYLSGWRYNTRQPDKGDNVWKMLAEFWRLAQDAVGG